MSKIIEVENKIVVLRKQQVLIDSDVAELYGDVHCHTGKHQSHG